MVITWQGDDHGDGYRVSKLAHRQRAASPADANLITPTILVSTQTVTENFEFLNTH